MCGIIPGKELVFVITYISIIIFTVAVSGKDLRTYNVSETAEKGFVVLTEKESGACTNPIITPNQNEEYLTFTANNLTLLRPLDLEVISSENLTVTYKCDGQDKEIHINVIAVNEFAPIFRGSPFAASIKENSPVGTEVIHLGNRDRWQDDDKFMYNKVVAYRLHPYLITAFDGKELFSLDGKTGNLTNSVKLDYESLRKSYMVNVSIQDDGGLLSFTTVNISVVDDDDNPPVFDADAYNATVDRFFQGNLTVLPRPVHAVDGDTGIRSNITYSIESDSEYITNLVLDPKSGRIVVIEPYANVTNGTDFDMLTIRMNITASEALYNHYNTTVLLWMYVYHDFPTTTIASTTKTSSSASTSTLLQLSTSSDIITTSSTSSSSSSSQIDPILLVEIIVPIVGAVLIIIVIIVIVKNKKKRTRETRYMLSQSEKKRKLDEHDHSKINVLSSTPINPYEMMSVYAKMNHNSNNGDIDQTRRAELTEYENLGNTANENLGNTAHAQTEENSNPDDVIPPDVYSMVDKRKQRKRQQQPLEYLNHAMNHNNDDANSSLEGSTNEVHGEDVDDIDNDQDATEACVANGNKSICLY